LRRGKKKQPEKKNQEHHLSGNALILLQGQVTREKKGKKNKKYKGGERGNGVGGEEIVPTVLGENGTKKLQYRGGKKFWSKKEARRRVTRAEKKGERKKTFANRKSATQKKKTKVAK